MNISSLVRNLWLCTAVGLLFCFSITIARAEGDSASAKRVVERLYQDYAWVVLIDNPSAVRMVDQPESVLEKYFTTPLSNLISKDHKCVEETKDICNLDFDPIYDSQDPEGVHQLRIEPMNSSSIVQVTFLPRWSSPAIAEIQFKMVHTPEGWRIDDIYYKSHDSFRAILQKARH
jgi:hypothetical protein